VRRRVPRSVDDPVVASLSQILFPGELPAILLPLLVSTKATRGSPSGGPELPVRLTLHGHDRYERDANNHGIFQNQAREIWPDVIGGPSEIVPDKVKPAE
jgi:hypothetical protein